MYAALQQFTKQLSVGLIFAVSAPNNEQQRVP
jgi:hypothetical protein